VPARATRALDGGDLVTRTAFVIPADPAQPCRTVEWLSDADLLPLLRQEIGCRWVERVSVEIDGAGRVMVWVDENGLYAEPRIENHRFNTFAANLGQPRRIFGTAVLTGDDMDGSSLGLPAELLADLPDAVEGAVR
jgi:hypothetical protein